MTEVINAAAELQQLCRAQRWEFCFIGGLAVQRWGVPRATIDVDLSLLTGFGREDHFIEVLLEHFEGRIEGTAQFARERRVLLLKSDKGVGLDIAFAALPFEERAVQRATLFEYPPGVFLQTCSAEDLVILKAFAGRGQDWVDVEGIIVRQTGQLDWNYIDAQLRPLAELKGQSEILTDLEVRRIKCSS